MVCRNTKCKFSACNTNSKRESCFMLVKPEVVPEPKKVSLKIPLEIYSRLELYVEALSERHGGLKVPMDEVISKLAAIAMNRDREFRKYERSLKEKEVAKAKS